MHGLVMHTWFSAPGAGFFQTESAPRTRNSSGSANAAQVGADIRSGGAFVNASAGHSPGGPAGRPMKRPLGGSHGWGLFTGFTRTLDRRRCGGAAQPVLIAFGGSMSGKRSAIKKAALADAQKRPHVAAGRQNGKPNSIILETTSQQECQNVIRRDGYA